MQLLHGAFLLYEALGKSCGARFPFFVKMEKRIQNNGSF